MLSSKDIRNVKFSKSVGGYKQEEVDTLLDKVEAEFIAYERTVEEQKSQISALKNKLASLEDSQSSIQSVLLSAQKLADQIVAEAKEKSAQIINDANSSISDLTVKEQELVSEFERNASIRKDSLNREIEATLEKAKTRSDCIEKATEDSIMRQQALFNKLKLEIAAFKTEITNKYKEHLAILKEIPDSVQMDPVEIAAAVSEALDSKPDVNSFIPESASETPDTSDELPEENSKPVNDISSKGFVITAEELNDNQTED